MERKFRYGLWKMPEWNGRQSSIQKITVPRLCCVYCAQSVGYVWHHIKYIAICSIDAVAVADGFDRFNLFKTRYFLISFEIDILPSGKFFSSIITKIRILSSPIEHTDNSFYC